MQITRLCIYGHLRLNSFNECGFSLIEPQDICVRVTHVSLVSTSVMWRVKALREQDHVQQV